MTIEQSTIAQPQRVTVTDIDMPFLSMVTFMVKWAIAAIPAALILLVVGAFVVAAMSGVGRGLSSAGVASSGEADSIAAYESDFARWKAECQDVPSTDTAVFNACRARKADLDRRDRRLSQ